MPDLDGNVGLAPDAESFVQRRNDGIALVADVRGVGAAEFRRFRRQRDQFLGLRVRRRGVLQRRGEPHRALPHGIAHQRFHAFQLRRAGRAVVIAQHHTPHLRRPYVARQVNPHSLLAQPREVVAEGAPRGLHAVMLPGDVVGFEDGVVQRRDRTSLAGDLRGDSLEDLRGQMRVDQNGHLRLAEHVDEPRRHHHAARVDGASAGAPARSPMAAILPARIPTSAAYHGEPVPSMTCPLRITTS